MYEKKDIFGVHRVNSRTRFSMTDLKKKARTMSDIAAKILSNDNMPRWAVSSVKLLLDLSGDVFLDVELFEGGGCDVD